MIEMSPDEDSAEFSNVAQSEVLRFLLVEDSATDAHVVKLHLKKSFPGSILVRHAESMAAAKQFLNHEVFDLVLLDLTLPDSSGLDTFHQVFKHNRKSPILILSGHNDSELAVIAVRDGAQNYILKGDLNAYALGREVRFAIERNKRVAAERRLKTAEEQIRIARKLQKSLYPLSAPTLPGFDIAGHAWAAEHACGDYFDFVPMLNGDTAIVVGDVSGHGLGPALKMVETRAALHSLCQYEDQLGQLIAQVHRVFCSGRPYEQRGLFLTMFLARLDLSNRILHYSSAGHPAFHLPVDGDFRQTETMDYPIGLVDEMEGVEDRKISLVKGDVVVVPTDGFYESGINSSESFGIDRMMAFVRANRHLAAKDIILGMYQASRQHTSNMPQEDDMAAIVIKVL